MTDELITDHAYIGPRDGLQCTNMPGGLETQCYRPSNEHANPGGSDNHLINTHPHEFAPQEEEPTVCGYSVAGMPDRPFGSGLRVCGYPEQLHHWAARDRKLTGDVVRLADTAQYAREPMPDAARRGVVVTLIDAPTDPLGTLAVLSGIYRGSVARSKAEVTDEDRRTAWADMMKTVLSGPLEAMQFTFLIEGVDRAITHQLVRNRFAFVAQESLRFAVADDWAQEIPLPPSLAGKRDDDPAVVIWRQALNAAEDRYAALVAAGMPAEEARGLLPHAITTRLYVTWSMRSLLMEAGKRTCTQAQFPWRQLMGGVAKALRKRNPAWYNADPPEGSNFGGWAVSDGWQYRLFADAIRPVCYQEGRCTFMASMDRGCTIRERVEANARIHRPSSEWHLPHEVTRCMADSDCPGGCGMEETKTIIPAIDPSEWATDPAAARTVE